MSPSSAAYCYTSPCFGSDPPRRSLWWDLAPCHLCGVPRRGGYNWTSCFHYFAIPAWFSTVDGLTWSKPFISSKSPDKKWFVTHILPWGVLKSEDVFEESGERYWGWVRTEERAISEDTSFALNYCERPSFAPFCRKQTQLASFVALVVWGLHSAGLSLGSVLRSTLWDGV